MQMKVLLQMMTKFLMFLDKYGVSMFLGMLLVLSIIYGRNAYNELDNINKQLAGHISDLYDEQHDANEYIEALEHTLEINGIDIDDTVGSGDEWDEYYSH